MIDSQLRTSGVNDAYILERMNAVARERFVPPAAGGHAYIDRAIALGEGRFLAAPAVHAAMLQQARPCLTDRALVVDGGSGYLPELLAPLVGSLAVMSPDEALAGSGGAQDGGFTLVMIDGAVEVLPAALIRRLAPGARVVTGWLRGTVTCLATGREAAGEVALVALAEIGIPVLPEFAAPQGWSF